MTKLKGPELLKLSMAVDELNVHSLIPRIEEYLIRQIMITNWRKTIKFQGIKHRYNFLDEYEHIISQSLVSSIQSMTNNVNVHVDEIKLLEIPRIWIELSFVIFLVSSILTFLTTSNLKMLLPLSSLDFGIISNVIFKEGDDSCTGNLPTHYNMKISWPFKMVYFQDKTEHLVVVLDD